MLFPACDALTVHVPVAMKVKVLPETVQTSGVEDVNVTAKPDELLALNAMLCPRDCEEGTLKVMV